MPESIRVVDRAFDILEALSGSATRELASTKLLIDASSSGWKT